MRFKKKASEMFAPDTIMFWIIYGVVLGFVAIYFVIGISKLGYNQSQIHGNLESFFLKQRFLKSANCFMTEREITGNNALNFDKFNEEQLRTCYSVSDNSMPAFNLVLQSSDSKIDKSIKTANWNPSRALEQRESPRNVLLLYQGKIYNGEMIIEIQNQR